MRYLHCMHFLHMKRGSHSFGTFSDSATTTTIIIITTIIILIIASLRVYALTHELLVEVLKDQICTTGNWTKFTICFPNYFPIFIFKPNGVCKYGESDDDDDDDDDDNV